MHTLESKAVGKLSLVLVDPKPAFFVWLAQWLGGLAPPETVEDVYAPEENGAWLVPSFGSVRGDASAWLDNLKPFLLSHEMKRFGAPDISSDVDATRRFDEWFEIRLRDFVDLVPQEELGD